jgi:hypothetical protein
MLLPQAFPGIGIRMGILSGGKDGEVFKKFDF